MKAIRSVLIIGGGATAVQTSDELDAVIFELAYSLKQQGIRVILLDDNPFSFTSDSPAVDRAVVMSLTTPNLLHLIKEEDPDAILPTAGNKLSFALVQEVMETGILQEKGIKLLGVPEATIRQVNHPSLLSSTLHQMGAPTKKLVTVNNFQDAVEAAGEIGYPVAVAALMPEGVSYRRLANNRSDLNTIVTHGLQQSRAHQVVISQSLAGFKEIEAVVMRDHTGTTMLLSMLEDLNPIGIHAGDSIVVNPAQTMRDREIQKMRNIAFAIARKLRIVGVVHVQFAFDQEHEQGYVIKVSPYFDRAALFAERSTGYPIAPVCAALYAGRSLREINLGPNFDRHAALEEPAMDHVAVRLPFFDLQELPESDVELGTQKRSIGAVMGVGRTFNAAIVKAVEAQGDKKNIQSLMDLSAISNSELAKKLVHPHANFHFVLLEALRRGYSISELAEMTKVDRYYLARFTQLLQTVKDVGAEPDSPTALHQAKTAGLCDWVIARLWGQEGKDVRQLRHAQQLARTYKEVEPSAGELDQHSGLFYSGFGVENEVSPMDSPTAVVVGTGPIALGNGAASDYCTAGVIAALKTAGFHTAIIDNNPSAVTLSPVFAERRYIEPLTSDGVIDVIATEKPRVIVVPAGRKNLIQQLQGLGLKDCQLVVLPFDTQPTDVINDDALVAVNFIHDGTYFYPLATTGALRHSSNGHFMDTDLCSPAEISEDDDARLQVLGRGASGQLTSSGLYQLWCVRKKGRLEPYKLKAIPATQVAFLAKVLGINLPGIALQLKLKTFHSSSLPHWLNVGKAGQYAIYHARYPFHELHLVGEKATAAKAIGGWMEIHRR